MFVVSWRQGIPSQKSLIRRHKIPMEIIIYNILFFCIVEAETKFVRNFKTTICTYTKIKEQKITKTRITRKKCKKKKKRKKRLKSIKKRGKKLFPNAPYNHSVTEVLNFLNIMMYAEVFHDSLDQNLCFTCRWILFATNIEDSIRNFFLLLFKKKITCNGLKRAKSTWVNSVC